jgi:hypothetical protein
MKALRFGFSACERYGKIIRSAAGNARRRRSARQRTQGVAVLQQHGANTSPESKAFPVSALAAGGGCQQRLLLVLSSVPRLNKHGDAVYFLSS